MDKTNHKIVLSEFSFCCCKNSELNFSPNNIDDLISYKMGDVVLPHDIALSVMPYHMPNEFYFSKNSLESQKYEDLHAFYFATFDSEEGLFNLKLNRVDLYADVYLNGEKVLSTDNAFIAFEKEVSLLKKNELVIHIRPVMLESRKYKVSPSCFMLKYNGACVYARKPAHSYSWDIFPRNVLGGIFDVVEFSPIKKDKILENYFFTQWIKGTKAKVTISTSFALTKDTLFGYEVEIIGECEDSRFYHRDKLWSNLCRNHFEIENCKLWEVKNFGKPYLYNLTIRLYHDGKLLDERFEKVGIRTVALERTSYCDENGGKFKFIVNGRDTFILGTNWVPVDAMYSHSKERLGKALELLDESGCNMVRVWGGGIYEPDEFYEYCDEHGILVWQDFMMACGLYPQDENFLENLKKEATQVVVRLRNHPSIALWAGDNEVDSFVMWQNSCFINPNFNKATRETIPEVLFVNDPTRVYLPSSPYYDQKTFEKRAVPSEDHCWGPRDYFKSEYYRDATQTVGFISEIGYMGIPCESSLRKFIQEDALNDFHSDDYLVHISSPETENAFYQFRVDLNLQPIIAMFGEVPNKLEDAIACSQITEAEALKYFIERMRIRKKEAGGIIWWNLIDGWPQLSDSVVDYYHVKKLAWYYVLSSQQYVCFIMNETEHGVELWAVNDTNKDEELTYSVENVDAKEQVFCGSIILKANSVEYLGERPKTTKAFFNIEWNGQNVCGKNHFFINDDKISLSSYVAGMQKCGLNIVEKVNGSNKEINN